MQRLIRVLPEGHPRHVDRLPTVTEKQVVELVGGLVVVSGDDAVLVVLSGRVLHL